MRRLWQILAMLSFFSAGAQVGVLDESFGPNGDGTVSQYFIDNAMGRKVAIQSDGKILVAIEVQDFFLNNFKILRYTSDGIIDSTFGVDGIIDIDYFEDNDFVADLIVLPDDRILVGGYGFTDGDSDLFVARLEQDGSPDPGFGVNGLDTFDLDTRQQYLGGMDIQSDGKILLAGWHVNNVETDALLIRREANGGSDTGFGNNGLILENYGINDEFRDVIVGTGGKISAVGQTLITDNFDILLTRFEPNGQPDSGLDGDGVLLLDLDQDNDRGLQVAELVNGDFLIGGSVTEFGAMTGGLVRVQPDGTFDAGFGNAGWRPLDDSGPNIFSRFIALPDGKILTLGYQDNLDLDIQLYQMDEFGALDLDFGNLGVILTDLEVDESAADMVFQQDGKLVVTGSIDPPGLFDVSMLLLRYDAFNPVSISEVSREELVRFDLFPNPARLSEMLTMVLELELAGEVEIYLADALGSTFQLQVKIRLAAGSHTIRKMLPPGLVPGVYHVITYVEGKKKSVSLLLL